VLGLLPMALGLGEGAELRAPLAITVIWGLSIATLVTLVVVPVLYLFMTPGGREPVPAAGGKDLSRAPARLAPEASGGGR
jgi:HAE1 family hydrophobic/amphiphilic exporter-1